MFNHHTALLQLTLFPDTCTHVATHVLALYTTIYALVHACNQFTTLWMYMYHCQQFQFQQGHWNGCSIPAQGKAWTTLSNSFRTPFMDGLHLVHKIASSKLSRSSGYPFLQVLVHCITFTGFIHYSSWSILEEAVVLQCEKWRRTVSIFDFLCSPISINFAEKSKNGGHSLLNWSSKTDWQVFFTKHCPCFSLLHQWSCQGARFWYSFGTRKNSSSRSTKEVRVTTGTKNGSQCPSHSHIT